MTDITRQLEGKQVSAVWRNGATLMIQSSDGSEITVQWVDDNGRPLKGTPVISSKGWRLKAQGLHDLVNLPNPHAPAGRLILPR